MSKVAAHKASAAGPESLRVARVETDADRDALLDIDHELHTVGQGWHAPLMDFYRDRVYGAAETWIARQDGCVLGGIAAVLGPDGFAAAERTYCQLARFATAPGLDRIALASIRISAYCYDQGPIMASGPFSISMRSPLLHLLFPVDTFSALLYTFE
jgi:hypothetical protein